MHSHQRARGKILFEVFCALGLAASFAGAWDQTGASALLASASIVALFAIYWSFGLFARRQADDVAQPTPAWVDAPQPAVQTAVVDEPEAAVQAAVQEDFVACEPERASEPEPVAPAPKKRRARKAQKAPAAVAAMVEPPQPAPVEEPVFDGPPLEQLFEAQPFVRQPRPAFGRKARGPRPQPAG